jgi:hypothetical protein
MGLFFRGLPTWLLQWVTERPEIQLAVETGTFRGDSAAVLAEAIGKCVTIERDPSWARFASQRFTDDDRVEVLEGSSRTVLPELCRTLSTPTFFWLDGHWSGAGTAGEDDPCPVLGELDAIALSPAARRHVVAVDDSRLFGMGHALDPEMKHFPKLSEVLARIEAVGLDTFVLDDVVVGVPAELRSDFCTLSTSPTLRQSVFLFAIWDDIEAAAAKKKVQQAKRKSPGFSTRVRRSLKARLSRH